MIIFLWARVCEVCRLKDIYSMMSFAEVRMHHLILDLNRSVKFRTDATLLVISIAEISAILLQNLL